MQKAPRGGVFLCHIVPLKDLAASVISTFKQSINMISEEEIQEDETKPDVEGNSEPSGELSPEDHDPLAEMETKYAEANDKYLRIYSEFENFRRRTAREKLEMISTASSDIIKDLLPAVDDFERAQKATEAIEDKAAKAALEGYTLVLQKLNGILKSKGLKKIEALGEPFDVELHEAITKIPVDSKKQKGKVVDVIENGYMLGDKVIRFAKVVIGE